MTRADPKTEILLRMAWSRGTGDSNAKDRKLLDSYREQVEANAVASSDHDLYRKLVGTVDRLIAKESEPDNWDGDEDELTIMIRFLEWLPDMIRHNDAEKIRASVSDCAGQVIDPFERTSGGQWIRRSDGEPVPWPIVED